MKMILRFTPFIALTLVARFADWRWGVVAALVTLAVVTVATPPRRLGVLGGAMLVFFLGAGVLALTWPDQAVGNYLHACAAGWLSLVALASIAVGRPFTVDFAKEQVGPEVARSSEFLAVNRRITFVWAAAFAAAAVAGVTAALLGRPLFGVAGTALSLLWAVKRTTETTSAAVGRAPAPTA
jgi:hypothetical protein